MALVVGKDMATGSFARTFADIDLDDDNIDSVPIDCENEATEEVRTNVSSSGTSKRKRKKAQESVNDEQIKFVGEQLGKIANALEQFTADKTPHLYEEVMSMEVEGFDDDFLCSVFDYLVSHESEAKAFLVKIMHLDNIVVIMWCNISYHMVHFPTLTSLSPLRSSSSSFFSIQNVQKALLQSDVQSKTDKTLVTVADYGSQAVDSKDLCKDGAQEIVERITKLVNDSLTSDGSYNVTLSTEDVLRAIDSGISEGGCQEVGCLFFAEVGGGTYMQPLDGSSAVKVQVSAVENPEEASFFESYEAAHSMHDLSIHELKTYKLAMLAKYSYIFSSSSSPFHILNLYNMQQVTLSIISLFTYKLGAKALPVRIDSQAKYGALSRGDGAIYLRFPHKGYREKIWDHAAGCIVVTEAGGVVTDAAGQPLDFSKGKHLDVDTGIIVSNQKLMPLLLNAVKESLKEKAPSS
ncbi:hypothetical protein V6Z12_A04G134600 [Gossypium hirsutum]